MFEWACGVYEILDPPATSGGLCTRDRVSSVFAEGFVISDHACLHPGFGSSFGKNLVDVAIPGLRNPFCAICFTIEISLSRGLTFFSNNTQPRCFR